MHNKLTVLGLLATAALGFSAISHADAGSGAAKATTSASADYSLLDADRDGKLSKREAGKNKDLATKFGSLDTNTDGNLDSGEFALFEGSASTTLSPSGSSSSTSTGTTVPGSATVTPPPAP